MLKFCSAPWNSVHINSSGDVSSCFCNVWHTKGYNGNILTTPLHELVNNQWQTEFRASILDQSFKYCRTDTCVDYWRLDEVDNTDFISALPTLPTTIQLQIDKDCNLTCGICRPKLIYSPDVRLTAYRILEQITQEYQNFNHKVNVHCDGSGDVFVSSAYQKFLRNEQLPDCFYFNFQTNGNLLTKNADLIAKLKHRIEMVEVSLDAATEETYKQVRGGNFKQVLQGIELLKSQGITVWTQFVVHQQNYLEILDYVKLCKELGVDRICLQLIIREPHMTMPWWGKHSLNNPSIDQQFLHQALAILEQDPTVEISGGLKSMIAQPIQFKSRVLV
jgi:MoaA/NifB/PqqE/SkfB family radical SAM enzyme